VPYLQKFSRKKHIHRHFKNLDSPMQELTCICGKVQGSQRTPQNNYHAKTCFYNGYL
jgi:hypothetical protein